MQNKSSKSNTTMENVTAKNIDEVKPKKTNAKPKKTKITVSPIHHNVFKMLRNNTTLRFHTAKYLRTMHGFKADDNSVYVIFLLDRYSVKVNTMEHQFPYTTDTFIQAFYAAQQDVYDEFNTSINNFAQDVKGCSIEEYIDNLNADKTEEKTKDE